MTPTPKKGQVCRLADCPTWEAEGTVGRRRIAVHRWREDGEPWGWYRDNGKPIDDPHTLVRPIKEE